jgi:hypothetical protein
MLFFTRRKKLRIVEAVINCGDLDQPSCTILSEFAKLAGASRKQRQSFIKEYRAVTGARYGSIGFIGLPLEKGAPLKMLRLFKLTEFYVYLGGERDNETDPTDF